MLSERRGFPALWSNSVSLGESKNRWSERTGTDQKQQQCWWTLVEKLRPGGETKPTWQCFFVDRHFDGLYVDFELNHPQARSLSNLFEKF